MRYLYVLAGGAAGSLLRYLVGVTALNFYAGSFPIGTFIVNITGSFLIGFALSRLPAGSVLRPLVVTGFLGGFTTFSSLEWETFAAARDGLVAMALLNMVGSGAVGYLACWIGACVADLIT